MIELIPDAPREALWRSAFRAHWIAGVIGIAMLPVSILAVIMILKTGSDLLPFHDDALDSGASKIQGAIIRVEGGSNHMRDGGGTLHRVEYEFLDHSGSSHHSFSLMHKQDIPEQVIIEYLADAPEISRIAGARRRIGGALDLVFSLCILPGFLCLLFWLRSMLVLKSLLGTGLVAAATVTAKKPALGVSPPQLRVAYKFITQTGQSQVGSHWVGVRSALGKALARDDRSAVIYDEANPAKSRLVLPSSFNR